MRRWQSGSVVYFVVTPTIRYKHTYVDSGFTIPRTPEPVVPANRTPALPVRSSATQE